MKIIAGVMVGGGLVLGSWAASRLSSDAVAMAIGMVLGVVAVLLSFFLGATLAKRGAPAGVDDTVRYSWLAGSNRVQLRGGGLDGMWRRDDGHAVAQPQQPVVIYQQQTQPERRFAVRWQSEVQS